MSKERTFAMLKPGVLQRKIVGEIISRLEKKCLKIIALKMIHVSRKLAEEHYAEHKGKDFYEPLLQYITSDPVIVMVLEREDAVASLRRLCGNTYEDKAEPGTIRGDYAVITRKNIIHASDSVENAQREIRLYFDESEIHPYEDSNERYYA